MAFRFRKSIKLAKGVRLNVGKESCGISLGGRGARVGFNTKKGAYVSGGIPGTGLYGIEYLGTNKAKSSNESSSYIPTEDMQLPENLKSNTGLGCAWSFLTFILFLSVPVLGFLSFAGQLIALYIESKSKKSKAKESFLLAKRFYDYQDYAQAIEKFNETLALYPTNFSLHQILGNIHSQTKNYQEAVFHYKEFLKQEDNLEIKFKLGNAYISNNQIQEAINVFQGFPAPYKEDLSVICSLATCFIELANYNAALEVLLTGPTRKRTMNDEMQVFRYLLGLCYQELGEKKKAIQQYNKVYAYNADFQDVSNKLIELEK